MDENFVDISIPGRYDFFNIINNKIENEKKFINVKLYGEKPSVVNAPSKKGAKNITKNLLLSKTVKLISLLLGN